MAASPPAPTSPVDDKPLWFKDTLATVASVGLHYVVVAPETGEVIGGGIRSATRTLTGAIGSTFEIGGSQG